MLRCSGVLFCARVCLAGWFFLAGNVWAGTASVVWAQLMQGQVGRTERVELFRISGSNTIGAHLAPDLVAGFLQTEGLQRVEVTPLAENAVVVSGVWTQGERRLKVVVPVQAHGSSTGFQALAAGSADVAASSRRARPEELVAIGGDTGLSAQEQREHVVAIDGLAIIVHPANPVQALTVAQIREVFSGRIRNWSELGGNAGAIALHARDDKSGTFDTFDQLVLQGARLAPAARRYESNERLAEAVLGSEAALGFVPLAAVGGAKALAVADGAAQTLAPSSLSIATEDYPLSRRLYLYTQSAEQRPPVLDSFLSYAQSNAGQQVVADSGFVAQSLHPVAAVASDSRLDGWQRLNMNIRFEDGSSALDSKAQLDVQRLSRFLAEPTRQDMQVKLVGYSRLDNATPAGLSRLRAQNVRWSLRQQGVDNKVATLAGGDTTVADAASRNVDRNRRVEVWVR